MCVFERHGEPLLTRRQFHLRMLKTGGFAAITVFISLFLGVAGYHVLEHLPWIDALLNASMILGGMGPVDPMKTASGKLFASFYALYSGLVLIGLMGLLLTPVFHRILHSFHTPRTKP
jgi:hypothetical protein